MAKSLKTAKSKKWIRAEKVEAFRAKNLGQSKTFFISKAKKNFTKLRQAFIKALIHNYFDLEYYIRIEIDESGYAIDEIFSQLTLDDLDQWYLVIIFSKKLILTKTRYETLDDQLLAIVKIFKMWGH